MCCVCLAKPQRHNMVHVEIWLGDGQTLGARWHHGWYVSDLCGTDVSSVVLNMCGILTGCTCFLSCDYHVMCCCFSVEVHDSYQFSAKSYHSMEYHFRSIETWLQGQCQRLVFSCCAQYLSWLPCSVSLLVLPCSVSFLVLPCTVSLARLGGILSIVLVHADS